MMGDENGFFLRFMVASVGPLGACLLLPEISNGIADAKTHADPPRGPRA
jgi:hypothetical protein